MEHFLSKNGEVRRRAEEKFADATQRDQDVMADRRLIQQAELDKLLRPSFAAGKGSGRQGRPRATQPEASAGAEGETGAARQTPQACDQRSRTPRFEDLRQTEDGETPVMWAWARSSSA